MEFFNPVDRVWKYRELKRRWRTSGYRARELGNRRPLAKLHNALSEIRFTQKPIKNRVTP